MCLCVRLTVRITAGSCVNLLYNNCNVPATLVCFFLLSPPWKLSSFCSLSIIPTSLSQLNKVVPHSLSLDPLFLCLSFSLCVSCGGNSAGFSFVLDLTMWLQTRTNTWFCQAPWKVLQHLQHGKQQETTCVCV